MPMGVISTTMKLKIQFVAAPRAAPFVRIVSELISVGYTIESVDVKDLQAGGGRPGS